MLVLIMSIEMPVAHKVLRRFSVRSVSPTRGRILLNISLIEAYISACLVSCGAAVGLGKLVENASRLPPGLRSSIQRVPSSLS